MSEDSTVKDDLTIIITDTETTGLCKPIPTDIQFQPFMTEIYACKINSKFEFLEEFETMVRPPIPISAEITKITGITDATLIGAPTFAEIYNDLHDFFRDTDIVVGQNIEFDINIIHYELMRHDWDKKFCWPKRHICTIESSYHYNNKRMKLADLHEFLFGEGFEDAHRAKSDVMATVRCFIELCKRGDIVL
jgi:DNA polymerase III epsilon subunit-like protein